MKKSGTRQDGMALLFAMIAIIVILAALGLMMTRVTSEKREADHAYDTVVLEEAAKAGIDFAIQQLWNRYIETNGNTTGNWASYRFFLETELGVPNTEDTNGNSTQDYGEVNSNGRDGWEDWPESYGPHGFPILEQPIELTDNATGRLLATIVSIDLIRNDSLAATNLTIRATAEVGGKRKAAVQKLGVGGAPFEGAQFAVLANNISCLLCHAEIRSLPLENNTDPSQYGSFDRVKIASLESLLVREDQAYSYVAGTTYTRGKVYKEDGSLYSASELSGDSLFQAYKFSSTNGKITQNSSGAMAKTPLKNGTTNSDGDLNPFANLYLDYPTDSHAQTDGPVPESFPAPFPDEDNDRMVDDEEFEVVVNSANGSVSFNLDPDEVTGAIKAGVAYGVPRGSAYTGTTLPAASNSALGQLASSGAYDGNLILVGTQYDPIVIEDKVAVNGDLVLKGPVKGRGQLLVRGNVYIMGDVTYADAPGEFGEDVNGNENLFAIVAGGSMMMGDYLTIRGVNHSTQNTQKFPDWSQYSIHARESTKSNTVTISKKTETLKWGYFDQWSVDPNQKVTGKPGQQFSFTMSELQLFNKMELMQAVADPAYSPRFYGLRESQPDKLYVYNAGDEHAVRYDDSGVKLLTDFMVSKGYDLNILNRAAFHYLNPDGNWISENTLRKIWYEDELTRPSAGRSFKFDGLLYSNNAIFQIVRSKTRHYSNTLGQMDIRGGVIAADLGVFVPEGFRLKYDERVERFLGVQDASRVLIARGAFYYDKADSEGAG